MLTGLLAANATHGSHLSSRREPQLLPIAAAVSQGGKNAKWFKARVIAVRQCIPSPCAGPRFRPDTPKLPLASKDAHVRNGDRPEPPRVAEFRI
jgi:hypothetical protein